MCIAICIVVIFIAILYFAFCSVDTNRLIPRFLSSYIIIFIHIGFPPHVYPTNFPHYMLLTEGSNRTFITNITSDLPLSSGYPTWRVSDHDLPTNSIVQNKIIDGVLCNKLLLYDLSYYNSGNYTITAGNECGTSLAFVYINVKKGMLWLFVYSKLTPCNYCYII